nr:MAG TPA: hypothetical protein [Caudoviricetes sp.]
MVRELRLGTARGRPDQHHHPPLGRRRPVPPDRGELALSRGRGHQCPLRGERGARHPDRARLRPRLARGPRGQSSQHRNRVQARNDPGGCSDPCRPHLSHQGRVG